MMVILFNHPIWLVPNVKSDVRKIVEVYGFLLPESMIDVDSDAIDAYVSYMCAYSRWLQEGNNMIKTTFLSNRTGKTYEANDKYMEKYAAKARQEMNVIWTKYNTNKTLNKDTVGMFEGRYIRSRKLHKAIKEYAALVDVQPDFNGVSETP